MQTKQKQISKNPKTPIPPHAKYFSTQKRHPYICICVTGTNTDTHTHTFYFQEMKLTRTGQGYREISRQEGERYEKFALSLLKEICSYRKFA